MSVRLALLKLRNAGIEEPRIEFSLGRGEEFRVWLKGNRGGQRLDLRQILSPLDIDFDLTGLADDLVQGP